MNLKMQIIKIIVTIISITTFPLTLDGAGWWKLYFTSPGHSAFVSGNTNPETGLISIIGKAEKYFYGAFYEVSSPRVMNALIAARKRGVDVKLVTEKQTARKKKKILRHYADSGIEVVTNDTRRRGLMHNKFAIIDGRYVWTGSYNPTDNDTARNDNNAILIYSSLLADIYENEFMEMFRDRIFGNRNEPGPFADLRNRYYVKIEDTAINAYFSPENNVERIILQRLKKAKISIYFMAFSFTSAGIGEMMIQKAKEGVQVHGIFERRGTKEGHSQYTKMKLEGLPVKLDHNRNLMHHKVIIIDGARVIMGSYNFSRNANRSNDENILIIDNKDIAAEYLSEFRRLW
jgi:phosphatidylserine/phosphatidylglycerophosphate/cardiolipin synthase-like enzyme